MKTETAKQTIQRLENELASSNRELSLFRTGTWPVMRYAKDIVALVDRMDGVIPEPLAEPIALLRRAIEGSETVMTKNREQV